MRTRITVTAALAALALAGCGTATNPGSTASPSSSPSASASTSPTPPGASSTPTVPPPADGEVPSGLAQRADVKAAMADAAGRAGIVPGKVVVAGYMAVTWADGSLGCPKKGMAYTQMTVEGELLLLRVDQRTMEYHARLGSPFSYCADSSGTYSQRTP